MLHHPHVITPHSKCAMIKHVVPSDCRLDHQLCATRPQYLGMVVICCLFSTLPYPGEVRVLVRVRAVDDGSTSADIIGKVGHVGAIMTNHLQPLHETTIDPVPCTPIYPKMFPEGLIFP
jgi:hypothetical protein